MVKASSEGLPQKGSARSGSQDQSHWTRCSSVVGAIALATRCRPSLFANCKILQGRVPSERGGMSGLREISHDNAGFQASGKTSCTELRGIERDAIELDPVRPYFGSVCARIQ